MTTDNCPEFMRWRFSVLGLQFEPAWPRPGVYLDPDCQWPRPKTKARLLSRREALDIAMMYDRCLDTRPNQPGSPGTYRELVKRWYEELGRLTAEAKAALDAEL